MTCDRFANNATISKVLRYSERSRRRSRRSRVEGGGGRGSTALSLATSVRKAHAQNSV